nr:phosphoenolpyruvate--protein phosphotransferase [Aneurinibacillus tyrosinisolvens]
MMYTGTAASHGIVLGRAIVKLEETVTALRQKIEPQHVIDEINRLKDNLKATHHQLETIKQQAMVNMGEEEGRIFEAHQLFLQDPEFIGEIEAKITNELLNAESAVADVKDLFVAMFEGMDNEYMRERAADLRDVSGRLLRNLLGIKDTASIDSDEPIIIVAYDLTPSDTAQLDKEKVKGFVTDIGGRTSHSAIMARTMGIPAVVGLGDMTKHTQDGDFLIVDGTTGEVHINPEAALIVQYEKKMQADALLKEEWMKLVHETSVTADGHRVELAANIGKPEDAVDADKQGAEAIGLFRTEFLYMGREKLPDEEEQFEAYKAVAQTMDKDRAIVIRTLDIGGDKELPYLNLPKEMNPFLGYRAIRLCLDRQDIFKTQLRAILRASSYGNIKIMYPMIASLRELRQANQILADVKQELREEKVPFNEEIEVGMMIEVPAAAITADQLAKEADFFSIGTNDLIQYTMAADRMNPDVSYLYDPFNPAVLRLIQYVIEAAHREGKWAGMCGEMAGEEAAVPLLLGLGLDEFSMSASSILRVRRLLKHLHHSELKDAAAHALTLESGDAIQAYIKETILDKI